MPKVSVVVPVFNPGADIDDCIASLIGQTLPPSEYEIVFVDDGSTDDTPARLDALAAAHPHVRVEHIENSGWPGRPRNVGVGLSRGEYIYFVDNDDWITRDALARLYEAAVADRADILIGKVVGQGRNVSRSLFAHNRHGERFDDPVLLKLLSPHKLFRRAFLLDHSLRFPEGKRRLEDHGFVVEAYFRAERISVLADRPVYHWVRRDERTASSGRFEPEPYFGNLREVLDLVEAHTEPGPWRQRLLAHWYEGKMLGRVGGPSWITWNADWRRELYETIRTLALERFDEGVHEHLPFSLRVRSKLLRAGAYEGLEELARFERRLRPQIRLKGLVRAGTHVTVQLESRLGSGRTWPRFERDGARTAWVPPDALSPFVPDVDRDVTGLLRRASVEVFLRNVEDGSEYLLPARTRVHLEPGSSPGRVWPRMLTTVPIAPTAAAAGGPLPPGTWEVFARPGLAGFARRGIIERRTGPLLVTTFGPGRIVVGTETPPHPSIAVRAYRRLPGPAMSTFRRTRAGLARAVRR